MDRQKIITLFGATGFVGFYIVRDLAKAGYRLRVIARDTESAAHLKTQGDVGQISVIAGDITVPESYQSALDGAYAVINLVGILFEKGQQTFDRIHTRAAAILAQHCTDAGVTRLLHMSALGVERATKSRYAQSKLAGEEQVRAAFPDATIFRPSVVFGAEDNFYNQFAKMAQFAPALPLISGGETKFQPVYVGDVAEAFVKALQHHDIQGQTYELAGPATLTFKEILQSINRMTHRDRALVTIPSCAAKFGAVFAEILPTPPLTRDQVRLLQYDNVMNEDAAGFAQLGIEPVSPDLIVPDYLERYAREIPGKREAYR